MEPEARLECPTVNSMRRNVEGYTGSVKIKETRVVTSLLWLGMITNLLEIKNED